MNDIEICKSRKVMDMHFIVISTLAILLVILSFVLLRWMRITLGIDVTLFGWILRGVIVLVAIAAMYMTNLLDKAKTYTFRGEKLIISNRLFGSKSRQTVLKISSSSVSNISLEQSFLDRKLNVGTVEISVDGYSKKTKYRIESIDDPKKIVSLLESKLGKTE